MFGRRTMIYAVECVHCQETLLTTAQIGDAGARIVADHLETHRIVNLSHQIGLWSQLPPDLRAHLADIAHLDPNLRRPLPTVSAGRAPRNFAPLDPDVRDPRETCYETVVASSSNAEWQQRLTTAPRFIEYLERDVIGNPAAFGKLTF